MRGGLHVLAPPRFAFGAFADDLARLVARLQPRLIVPTCEEVFYVAAAAARDGYADLVLAPAPEQLRTLHSKVSFADFARQAGVTTPDTHRVCSASALASWRHRADAVVLKPEFSRFGSHTRVRPSLAGFDAVAPTPQAPWAVQDFTPGDEVCVWSSSRSGKVVAFAAYRPRWRIGRSASFYFETDADPALLRMTQAIAQAGDITGQMSFDVIRTPDGDIVPIECNPRGVSGIHLFDADARLAQALLGEAPSPQTPNVRARHISLAMWLMGAPNALVTGRLPIFHRDLARSRDLYSP